MKKFACTLAVLFLFVFASGAFAGTFWFPLEGHYPYSENQVTAVPDLDQRVSYMRSRMNETGQKSNGCNSKDSPSYPCTAAYVDGYSIWGYKKDGGGNWEFDGVPYIEDKTYLYYDNHRGYDFKVTAGTVVHTVEAGTFCGHVPSLGQICIQHSIPEGVYQTYYTHMTNIPSWLQTAQYGTYIAKWTQVGTVSNVGTATPHLHFTVRKYDPNHPDYARRKVNDSGWIVVDPYGLKNGPGAPDIEPYLWN